jgi:hypothetical protein
MAPSREQGMPGIQGQKEKKRLLRISVLIEWGKPEPEMRIEQVEIYSDATNRAIMRHPGRRFPGTLIQGDNMYDLCRRADAICAKVRSQLDSETYKELNDLRDILWAYLTHYKSVLLEHGIPLPFSEQQPFSWPPTD